MGVGLDIVISSKQLLNENKLSKCEMNIKFSLEIVLQSFVSFVQRKRNIASFYDLGCDFDLNWNLIY
jgi:hypothetical protein